MAFNRSEWENRYKLTIDSSKVYEDLTDFPVSVVLGSGTGQTGFDVSNIFDELDVVSGQEGYVDDDTKLLLHCGGDLSDSKHDVTTVGNPVIEFCTVSGVSTSCINFDGTGDCLLLPGSSDWNWGTGDFTVDFWVSFNSTANYPVLVVHNGATYTSSNFFRVLYNHVQVALQVTDINTDTLITASFTPVIGTFYHIAVTRSSQNGYLFIDGVLKDGPESWTGTITGETNGMVVGVNFDLSAYPFNGRMSEIRISKGLARWTSNFTPTLPNLISDSNTNLLLGFDGDTSSSGHAIAFNGGTKIESDYGKFGTSYYFDGSSDYLIIPDSDDWYFGSGDFTIDGWYNFNSLAGDFQFFTSQWGSSGNYGHLFYYRDASTTFRFIFGHVTSYTEYDATAIWTPTFGVWYHISVVKSGNSLMFFIDGQQLGNSIDVTGKTTSDVSSDLWIGCYPNIGTTPSSVAYFHGYMSEIRISKGIARWTSNFIPPGDKYGTSSWFNRKKIALTTESNHTNTDLDFDFMEESQFVQEDSVSGTNFSAGKALLNNNYTTWSEKQKIQPSDVQEDDLFGVSTAIYGNNMVVGAHGEDTGGLYAGSVYVFTISGTTWVEQQKIHALDKSAGDLFGYSLNCAGFSVVSLALHALYAH